MGVSMHNSHAPLVFSLLMAVSLLARAEDKVSTWNGYEKRDFQVDGRKALMIVPKTTAPGKPWIWRTEFFGHEPQGDLGLVSNGFHAVYIDMQNLYGGPKAMEVMDSFYQHLTERRGLSKKCVLEGFSRGGLYTINYAARHPDRVACIYNDAPVCDLKSWPGGKGKGKGSPGDWQRALSVYGKTEAEMLAFTGNPIDNLAPLAKARIPILHICGDADDVVPYLENTKVIEDRYKALGGPITVIVKPGVNHHPHSLKDPKPIVDFVLRHTLFPASAKP
jgi:pimeloyl-ACP methyl ester carboxylesterase